MWKRSLGIVLCLLGALALLVGCGDKPTETAADNFGTDYNQYINANGVYAVTNSAYYICESGRLRFLDPSLDAPISILCAKADCDHSDPRECSAYLPDGSPAVYAWNGALYYDVWSEDDKLEIYRMDLDGKNRKVVGELELNSLAGSVAYTLNIACGHLAVTLYDEIPAGEVVTLYLFSMEDLSEEPVVLFTNQEQVIAGAAQEEIPRPYPVYLSEEWLFFGVEQGSTGARRNCLYGYEISTGEVKQLLEDGFYPADDLSQQKDLLYWYDTDGAITTIDLTTGTVTERTEISVGEQQFGSMDERWIYISGGISAEEAEVAVYSLDGTEVQRLPCAELGSPLSYAFSTSDRIFFRKSGYTDMAPICFLETAALSEGKAELIPLAKD